MSEKTCSRILLNSDRADAKLLLEKARWAAENGGRFEIVNCWEESQWWSKVTIWWPVGQSQENQK